MLKGYSLLYSAHGRACYTRRDGKIKLEDALGKPGSQRWSVAFMGKDGQWAYDIGFPSLRKAFEYAEGTKTLRQMRRKQ